jgi:hypothetical protein
MEPRNLLVMSCLFLSLAAGGVWGQNPTPENSKAVSPASNIEGWHEGDGDELTREWTWFGMGFEFRNTTIRQSHSIASGIPIKRANGNQ